MALPSSRTVGSTGCAVTPGTVTTRRPVLAADRLASSDSVTWNGRVCCLNIGSAAPEILSTPGELQSCSLVETVTLCDTTDGAINVYLPAMAPSSSGFIKTLANTGSGTNAANVTGTSISPMTILPGQQVSFMALPGGSWSRWNSSSTTLYNDFDFVLCDGLGLPVPGTQFTVRGRVDVEYGSASGNAVKLSLPGFSFQIGPVSPYDPPPPYPITPGGGYIYTVGGNLPPELCPPDVLYMSQLAASDVGANPIIDAYTQQIPSSCIVKVTNAGGLIIQAGGALLNAFSVGPQSVSPTCVSYIAQPVSGLSSNQIASTGPTDASQFTFDYYDGIRDSHPNSMVAGVVALSWADNSTWVAQGQQANGILDTYVRIGTMSASGAIQFNAPPVNLTNFVPLLPTDPLYGFNNFVFDTAISINPLNPLNIVASWSNIAIVRTPSPFFADVPYRAVSLDGGVTWPVNGPLTGLNSYNVSAADCRGAAFDIFGNCWYSYNNYPGILPYPQGIVNILAVSSDGTGTVWNPTYYTSPAPAYAYDFPQFSFGGGPDPITQETVYGIWQVSDYFTSEFGLILPQRTFIAIYGLGSFGTAQNIFLNELADTISLPVCTASMDGRHFTYGVTSITTPIIGPVQLLYMSPGPTIDVNQAGPFDVAMFNIVAYYQQLNPAITDIIPLTESSPFGIFNTTNGIIFDDARQVLYALNSTRFPELGGNGQNMVISLLISSNNGLSWSQGYNVATTYIGNRGFASMSLDPTYGSILISWYDGRNYPSFTSLDFMATIVTAAQLDDLVSAVPIPTNPVYSLPSAGSPTPRTLSTPGPDRVRNAAHARMQRKIAARRARDDLIARSINSVQ